MLICPNKKSSEWKSLVGEIGEDKAMLAFFRNNGVVPSVNKANELLKYNGVLKSLDSLPKLSADTVVATLAARDLINPEPIRDKGKTWYKVKNTPDIAQQLSAFSETYPVLEYIQDYVTVDDKVMDNWNRMVFNYNNESLTMTDYAKRFLQRVGVSVVSQDNVIKEYGVNAIADFAKRMVMVQSGLEDTALPEEALHFFLDMMPQNDEALMEALDKIRSTDTYKKAFEQYKNNPNYKDSKGNIRFDKIKKEALAKEIAARGRETEDNFITKLVKKILEWIKGKKIQRDPIEILKDMFMSEQIDNLNLNLNSNEIYNQMSDEDKAFYEAQNMNEKQKESLQKILQFNSSIAFDEDKHMLVKADALSEEEFDMTITDNQGNKTTKTVKGSLLRSVTASLGSDFTSELEDPVVIESILDSFEDLYFDDLTMLSTGDLGDNKKVARALVDLITDKINNQAITKEELLKMTNNSTRIVDLLFMASENKRKTLFGTAMHRIIEEINKDQGIDLNDMGEEVNKILSAVFNMMDRKTLNKMIFGKDGIIDVLKELRSDGSILLNEVAVGNSKMGGIIDIIRIRPDGSLEIYDFKNKYLRKRADNKDTILEEFHSVIRLLSKDGVKNEPGVLNELKNKKRRLVDKWGQQLTLYKKLLMEAGFNVGDTAIIGIPYMLDEKTNMIDKFAVEKMPPSKFDTRLGNHLFPNLDLDKDANSETVELTPDERLAFLNKMSREKLMKAFTKSTARLEQLRNFVTKNKDAQKILDLITDQRTRTNSLRVQEDILKTTLESMLENDDASKMEMIQKNFLSVLDLSVPVIESVSKAFEELRNTTPTDTKSASQRLNELSKMRDFLIGYQTMFEELLGYMETTDQNNPVVSHLTKLIGVIQAIRKDYVASIEPTIAKMLQTSFSDDLIGNLKGEYQEMIVAAKQRGDKKLEEKLRQEMADLPSEAVITDFLKGDKGDVGWFFGKLVATISNPDIILAGAAKKLKATLDRVRLMNKELRDNTSVEFNKRAQVYGRGLDQKKMNESLVYITTVLNPYNGKEMQQMFFKSEFDERLYYDYAVLQKNLVDAETEKDKDKIKAAKKAKKDFELKYFESQYTEEYYKLTAPLEQTVSFQGETKTIREITGAIFDDLRKIQVQYSKEAWASGEISPSDLEDIKSVWERYYSLKEKRDSKNKMKTGDALKIAEALEKYEENSKKLYDDYIDEEMFRKIDDKKKLELGENSKQYKKWLELNTVVSIKDEYFQRMQELLDEKAAILQNTESVKLAEVNRELNLLTRPYKDRDGIVKAQLMSSEKKIKMKQLEEERTSLMDSSDNISINGYTPEEQETLAKENMKKKLGHPYNKYLIASIHKDAEVRRLLRSESDPDYAKKVARLKEINAELGTMRTMSESKYYIEEMQHQMELFAEARGISVDELNEDASLYEEFTNTPWYLENHNIEYFKLYEDDEDVKKSESPIYAWKRFEPNAKYLDRKPGLQYRKRVMKESYTNEKGEEVQLMNNENRDVLNRFKPKANDVYRKQYGTDHPYRLKDFVDLETKMRNKTASAAEKVDYENLLYISTSTLAAQEDIELSQRLGLAVPFMEKTLTERTIETKGENIKQGVNSRAESIIQGIRRKFSRTDQDIDQTGTSESSISDLQLMATIDNNQAKFVPVRFSRRGEAENASYNVWSGFLNYNASINRKKELEKELAFVNGLEEILADTQNQPKSEASNMVINKVFKKYMPELKQKINEGGNTRLEVLRSFINSVMYNEEYFKGFDVLGVNTQKTVSQLMALTSYTTLGIAPFNWTVNWMSGNIQNIVEAAGGQYFNMSQFTRDKAMLFKGDDKHGSVVNDMMADYGKLGNRSFWGQVFEVFDPIQGEFENEYGHNTNFSKVKNPFQLGIFSGKIFGEWEIQSSAFISFLKNIKVYQGKMIDKETFVNEKLGDRENMSLEEITNKRLEALKEFDALDTNLLDVMELDKQGKLVVKDQFKDVFELGSQQFSDYVAKLHAMQKKINGSYAKIDKTYAEKTSIGRMMFFFRKYFIPLGLNRLGVRRVNYESMSVEEGFYLTFFRTFVKDIAKMKLNIVANWNNYSELEKRAIKKSLADAGFVLSIILLYHLALGYDPDDPDRFKKLRKKSWGSQSALYVLLKVKSETEQFLPGFNIQELKRIWSNPSMLLSEANSYIKMGNLMISHTLDVLPGFDYQKQLYYQKDVDQSGLKDEGDSKLLAEIVNSFSGYTGKTFHPVDAVKGFESLNR